MNEVLSLFILLTEILMILQCLQIVFKQELPFDKYVVGIIAFDFVIYMGINLKIMPIICSCIFYALTYIFCLLKFKQTKMKTAIRMIIAFSLAGCVEGIMVLIVNCFYNIDNTFPILAILSSVALFISWIIKMRASFMKKSGKTSGRSMVGMIVFLVISYCGVLLEYYTKFKVLNFYVIFVVFFLFCLYKLEQAHNEINMKNYELELQKVYGEVYGDLLSEVRKRQHDYKNQLSAIYGTHITAGSLEELISMQKEYGLNIQLKSKFDSIITRCENQFLAGYLYYKCIECERQGVIVDYEINVEKGECGWAFHEIIEILGILIDNASECAICRETKERCINLIVCEMEEKVILSVSNPSDYVTLEQIELMFNQGYSKKGENRGLGLVRAKELVNKYRAEIQVMNTMKERVNWIVFKIEICK